MLGAEAAGMPRRAFADPIDISLRAVAVAAATVGDEQHPGARALVSGDVAPASLLPAPVSVYEDWVRIEHWDCTPMSRFPMDRCTQPVDYEPIKRVVVVGDSHMQQLSGALSAIATQQHWQLTEIIRGACPFSAMSEAVPGEPDCMAWNEAALIEIADLRPDAVVTLASREVRVGLTEHTPPGFIQRWRDLERLGIAVLAIRDNPRFDYSMPDCVQQHESVQSHEDPAVCGASREELYPAAPPWTEIPDLPSNVTLLDIADAVCDQTFCPAQIGNVLVYLDDNHLSASYSSSMVPLLQDRVVAAIEKDETVP